MMASNPPLAASFSSVLIGFNIGVGMSETFDPVWTRKAVIRDQGSGSIATTTCSSLGRLRLVLCRRVLRK